MSAPLHPPVFAVVGRVNKGKSSVVATLAEDPSVAIAPRPGTTRLNTRFPVTVDGVPLFELVDTPGFEEADRALAWLQAAEGPRPERVRQLIEAHAGTDDFVEERTLLAPIMAGASILYVVDGAHPFRPNHRAEMEILQWTGRPAMALVNRIGDGDHTTAWQAALAEYFPRVRLFDAHHARFAERIALLDAFRELDPDAAPALQAALDALSAQRATRRAESALIVTDLLIDTVTLTLTETAESSEDLEARRDALEQRFHGALRELEARARRRVEQLYRHEAAWSESALARPVFVEDLFARRTWDQLGLSDGQLMVLATGAGAATGGAIDAVVGGASMLAGTAIGAGVGFVGALARVSRRYARARTAEGLTGLFRRRPGKSWRIGPHANPNFPFVLLDRALLHHAAVARRAHARQDAPEVDAATRPSTDWPAEDRKALGQLFDRLRKEHRDVSRQAREALHTRIEPLIAD